MAVTIRALPQVTAATSLLHIEPREHHMEVRCIFGLLAWVGVAGTSMGDDEQKARFQKEYPEAVKRLDERFSRAEGSCRIKSESSGKRPARRPEEAEFAADHGREKVVIRRYFSTGSGKASPADPHVDLVYCVNFADNTVFYLSRDPGKATYQIRGRGESPEDFSAYLSLFGRYFRANRAPFGISMSVLMKSPNFKVIDAEKINKDGRTLVRVEFAFGGVGSDSQASLVFDPENGWVIRSAQYVVGGRSKSFEVEYGPPGSISQAPKRVTFHEPEGASTCDFLDWRFEPTPIEEFRLSHYALPDLSPKPKPQRSAMPYWLGGSAVAALVLAVVARRAAARR